MTGRSDPRSGSRADTSGRVMDTSGRVMDPSGRLLDTSGRVIDASGRVMDGNASRVMEWMQEVERQAGPQSQDQRSQSSKGPTKTSPRLA